MKKIQLRSTKLGSNSLKRIATALSQRVGYKVLRTKRINLRKVQYEYGNLIVTTTHENCVKGNVEKHSQYFVNHLATRNPQNKKYMKPRQLEMVMVNELEPF